MFLLLSETNANMGDKVIKIATTIKRQNGIIENIMDKLATYDETVKGFFHDTIIDIMTGIIADKLVFSDDLLNLAWRLEEKDGNPLESKLWTAIEKACTQVIQSRNKRDWYWLKTHVVPSTVWYIDYV